MDILVEYGRVKGGLKTVGGLSTRVSLVFTRPDLSQII